MEIYVAQHSGAWQVKEQGALEGLLSVLLEGVSQGDRTSTPALVSFYLL